MLVDVFLDFSMNFNFTLLNSFGQEKTLIVKFKSETKWK